MTGPIEYSFVIPVYNEAASLRELHAQINTTVTSLGKPHEIIFVNDGSTDDSWLTICALAESDANIRAIRFRRNFGKASALAAGFEVVRGQIVFTLDADLQDDPAEIPNFLAKLDEGFDVVSGWKKIRHDPWHKVFPSRVFNAMVSRKTGLKLHDHNCGFKAFRREVLSHLKLYGERHRFVPVLSAAAGFRVGEVVIHHRARPYGESKYGWNRFLRGYLDLHSVAMETKYGYRPLHWYGSQSLKMLMVAVGLSALSIMLTVWMPSSSSVTIAMMVACTLLLGSMMTYLIGLHSEATLSQHPPTVPYTVSESIRRD